MLTSKPVEYHDAGTRLTGVLISRPESQPGTSAHGVLVVHGGAGLDEHAQEQARRYADLGYVVLAADMLGPAVTGNRELTMAQLREFRDHPELLVRRGLSGLTALQQCPRVTGRCAAIGFCFGGLAVLSLARAGAALAGVVSIHGSLATHRPARPGTVGAKILVCHGARDPHVPFSDVAAFAQEMVHAGGDWELIMYGGAMHGFTHRQAVPGATPGVAYDPVADQRSFAAARAFLGDLFR